MNAVTKDAPELTAGRLVAVAGALHSTPSAALKALHIDWREPLEAALEYCEKEVKGGGDLDDPDYALGGYRDAPFTISPGDDRYKEVDEGDLSSFLCSNFEETAWSDWFDHIRNDVRVPPNPWTYLLNEAERLVPGFSRWDLPGARLSVVDDTPPPLRLMALDDEEAPEPEWIVGGLVQEGSICAMVGAPGEGKTTLALALALHIAAGQRFACRGVLQGAVVYVAAEGHAGALKARARAMQAEYGMAAGLPLYMVPSAVNLLRPAEVDGLLARLSDTAKRQPIRAVILDTLPQCMVGGDENSAQSMGQAVASMARIKDAFGVAVIALTHPAKGGSGARGSSALLGALDTQIGVSATREGNSLVTVTLANSKQRNAAPAGSIVFDMTANPATLIPVHREEGEAAPARSAAASVALSPKAKRALAWLAKNGPATEAAWRGAVASRMTTSTDGGSQRKSFYRIRDELVSAGAVASDAIGQWCATS